MCPPTCGMNATSVCVYMRACVCMWGPSIGNGHPRPLLRANYTALVPLRFLWTCVQTPVTPNRTGT